MTAMDEPPTATQNGTDPAAIDTFIRRWQKSGGSEMANFQPFAKELCELLGLPEPEPAQEEVECNDYVFERRVDYKFDDGTTARRRIDLYKRDRFVMEAKQSAKRVAAKEGRSLPAGPDPRGRDAGQGRHSDPRHGALGQGDARRQEAG